MMKRNIVMIWLTSLLIYAAGCVGNGDVKSMSQNTDVALLQTESLTANETIWGGDLPFVQDNSIYSANPDLLKHGFKESKGITFKGQDGTWHIYGTPEESNFISLAGGEQSIPKWMQTGKTVYVEINGQGSVELIFRAFNKDYPDGIRLLATKDSAVYKIPDLSSFTGIDVRLQVSGGKDYIDTVVTPILSFELPDYGRPLLTIIDDDGDIHYLKDILPLCNEIDVNISTAVSTTWIGTKDRWMTWDDIRDCYAAGTEVLCHTYSHPTVDELSLMSDTEIMERLTAARNRLMDEGISTGDILVYSSGTGYEPRMFNAARTIFKAGIVIGGNTVNSKDSDPYQLKRYRIDFATGDGDKSRKDYDIVDIKRYIDTISDCGGWGIMMFHTSNRKWSQLVEVDQEGRLICDENNDAIPLYDKNGDPILDNDGTQYERTMGHLVYVPLLKEAINYAREKGVEIVSVKNGYRMTYETE